MNSGEPQTESSALSAVPEHTECNQGVCFSTAVVFWSVSLPWTQLLHVPQTDKPVHTKGACAPVLYMMVELQGHAGAIIERARIGSLHVQTAGQTRIRAH